MYRQLEQKLVLSMKKRDKDKYAKYGKYSKYFELLDKYGGGLEKWEKRNQQILEKSIFPG